MKKKLYKSVFCALLLMLVSCNITVAQTDTTYRSYLQIDTTYYVNEVKVRVFKSDETVFFIIEDTSSYFMVHQGSTAFCHYDSLNRLRLDSVICEKWGNRDYYHYVDGKRKLKYTYYHKRDINVFETVSQNDSVAIVNIVRFKDNDTVFQNDTIFLYYPNSGSINYYSVNITLEALGEKAYSSDTSNNNKMRIFMMKYGEYKDGEYKDSVVLYTISDIFKKSLQVTKKTGNSNN